jgi:hypothetical protein
LRAARFFSELFIEELEIIGRKSVSDQAFDVSASSLHG